MARLSPRTLVLAVGATVLLVAVGAAAGFWWYMAVGQHPLRGDLSHDLGTIEIVDGTARGTHVFTLRNVTSDAVVIEAVRTGCGCTSAEASAERVEPGETIEVRGTLTLRRPETKRTHIALWLEGGHEQRLWLKAKAVAELEPGTE